MRPYFKGLREKPLVTHKHLWQFVSLAVFLLLWQLFSVSGLVMQQKLPGPIKTVAALVELATIGMPPGYLLWGHIEHSLLRVWLGFLAAGLLAISLGIMIGVFPYIRLALSPLIEILRPIPPLAWIPLSILWFGIGNPSAVFVIFIGAFFPILLNTVTGIETVEKKYIDVACTLGSSQWDIIRRVLLPGALPIIFTGLKLGWQICWMTLIAAEFTGIRSGYGLGYLIIIARDIQRPAMIVAGMLIIGVIGYFSNFVFELWRWKKIRWM